MEIEEEKKKNQEESSSDEEKPIPSASFKLEAVGSVSLGAPRSTTVYCLAGTAEIYGLALNQAEPVAKITCRLNDVTKPFGVVHQTETTRWVIMTADFPKLARHNFKEIFSQVSGDYVLILLGRNIRSFEEVPGLKPGLFILPSSKVSATGHSKVAPLPEGLVLFDFPALLFGFIEKNSNPKTHGAILLGVHEEYTISSGDARLFDAVSQVTEHIPSLEKAGVTSKTLSGLVSSVTKRSGSNLYI
jgi:hypothetical protein